MKEALADAQLERTNTSACREGVHVFVHEQRLLDVTHSLSCCNHLEINGHLHLTVIVILGVEQRLQIQQVFGRLAYQLPKTERNSTAIRGRLCVTTEPKQ